MSTDTRHDPLEFHRENARLAAIGLAIRLTRAAATIVLLMTLGPSMAGFLA